MVRKPQVAALAAASLATLEGRFDAALESFGGIDDISAPGFDTLQARAYLHLVRHDYVAARRLFETLHPGFFAADGLDQQLKTAPQDACYASYILLRTGSAQWGQEVLERTLEFVENELPTYIKDADVAARQAHCLAIKGEFDAAMAALEREFEVGAFHEFPTLRYREYFEPLFGDPRFESLMSRYEEEIARQRARLDAWEAERADT